MSDNELHAISLNVPNECRHWPIEHEHDQRDAEVHEGESQKQRWRHDVEHNAHSKPYERSVHNEHQDTSNQVEQRFSDRRAVRCHVRDQQHSVESSLTSACPQSGHFGLVRERLAMAACYVLVWFVLPTLLFFPPYLWRFAVIKLVLAVSILAAAIGLLALAAYTWALVREELQPAPLPFDQLDDEALLSLDNTRRARVLSETGHLPPSMVECPARQRPARVSQGGQ